MSAPVAAGVVWNEDTKARFAASWIDVDSLLDLLSGDHDDPAMHTILEDLARGRLEDLHRVETFAGPPEQTEAAFRRRFEAERDPSMPPWIRRPWMISSQDMLAIEEILVQRFGSGCSASSSTFSRWLPGDRLPHMLVHPVPGMLAQDRDARKEIGAETTKAILDATGLTIDLDVWNDVPPEKALNGLMIGTVVRDGSIAAGVVREVWDWSED